MMEVSPMTSSRDLPSRTLVLGMVLLFLIADMAVPMMAPASELDEQQAVFRVTSTVGAVADTWIAEGASTTNYESNTLATIGLDGGNSNRFLLEFAHNLSTSDTVESATLKVTCGSTTGSATDAAVHAASIDAAWSAASATWQVASSGASWSSAGADGPSDRGVWEPPVQITSTGQFSLNVTALAQDAVRSGTNLSLLLDANGAGYECSTSEASTSSERPELTIVHTTGTMGAGGSITTDMPADGSALMTSDLLLTADTTPAVSWTSASSGLVEAQFGLSSTWFTAAGVDRHLHPDDESSAYTSGSAELPSSEAFTNGTTVYWRARAADSNGVLGAWVGGHVVLPDHDVTPGPDGTASVAFNDLGLSSDTIEEAFVTESSKNLQSGSSVTFGASMTSTKEAFSHVRLNLHEVGLASDAAIVDARLNLTVSSITGTPLVSVHPTSGTDWVESQTTWNLEKTGTLWAIGGRGHAASASDAQELSSSDTEVSFNITSIVQAWVHDGRVGSQTMLLTARGLNEGYTNGDVALFDSMEATTSADRPLLSITYRQASNSPAAAPALTNPADGQAVWNLTGDNLSGNQTPDLSWTPVSGEDFLLQVASDSEFRHVLMAEDTRTSSTLSGSSTGYTPTGSDSLDLGNAYFWRMTTVDGDDQTGPWEGRSFVVSNLSSTWLGGDRYELRFSHGNGTNDGLLPSCGDTYIRQGDSSNYDGESDLLVALDLFSTSTVLIGCDLVSHLLPSGYAVESAELSLKISDAGSGSPVIGLWDSAQHNWTETGATWTTYDGTSSWGVSGATGWERGSLIDTVSFGTQSDGDRVSWNVTQSVQSAMREDRAVDFIMDVTGSATSTTQYAMFSANNQISSDRAELSIVYVPGSDAVPDSPTPVAPANGSWAVLDGINPASDTTPLLNWSYAGSLQIGGWALQLDTSPMFTSGDIRFVSSLNDAGFDLSNLTYEPQVALSKGTTWYWRVRAVSATNQLGNWSNVNHFLLPDTTTWSLSSTSAAVELHHHAVMPSLNLPHMEDTTVRSDGQADQTHASSTTLTVGALTGGGFAASLVRIPLDEVPVPSNARVTGAELSMFARLGSDTGMNVGVAPVNVNWNASANGTTFDGSTNWTSTGWSYADLDFSADFGEIGADYASSLSASWMVWEVGDLVQRALAAGQGDLDVVLFVDGDATGKVTFTSLEGTSNQRPWLNLTWTAGTASAATSGPTLIGPADDAVAFDADSHALLPDERPVLSWSHTSSSIDGWQVVVYDAWSSEGFLSGGWSVYDSRTDSGFDMTNQTYTPQSDLGDIGSVVWAVRPITSGLYGPWSSMRTVHIPDAMSGEVNADVAWVTLQRGSMVDSSVTYPTTPTDTSLDQGAPTTGANSATTLDVGLSFVTTSTAHRSSSLVGFDLSGLPLPGTYEVLNASLLLTTLSTSSGNGVDVSVSGVTTTWTSSATWSSPDGSGTWTAPGGYHSLGDTSVPSVGETQWVASTDTTYEWNVTELVQAMLINGDPLSFMLQAEDLGQGVGRQRFHSSEATNISDRPALTLTYRTTSAWQAAAPSMVAPAAGSTLWDTSAPRPTAPSTVVLDWSSAVTNATSWELCIAEDERFVSGLVCQDSLSSSTGFDLSGLELNRSLTGLNTDTWLHWMVRAEHGHRMGAWSSSSDFRHADAQGSDDGDGNHTVVLSRSSVFTTAPSVPSVLDATISSSSPTTNEGSSATLSLGQGAGGSGEQSILVDIDLSDLPWPTAMTPTQMLLRLYRTTVGSTSLTVAAYPCASFSESTVTWAAAPACSSTEITRSTLTLSPPNGWVDFDLTSLAQSNVANGNLSMTVLLDVVGTPGSTMTFHSSEYGTNVSRRPQLVLDYVDNIDGVQPPSQPSLTSPIDGKVIYATAGSMLEPGANPTMTWSALPDATDYILTFSGPGGQTSYRSWVDSEFLTNTSFRIDDQLSEGVVYEWWVQGVNQSIPGPSSSRWSFALGDPDTSDLGDTRYAYRFQTGNEVASLGHTRVREGMITNASGSTNYGAAATATLGTGVGCGGSSVVDACRMVVAVDFGQVFGQVPLGSTLQAHSAHLSMQVLSSGWLGVGGTTSMTLTAHRVLASTWTELGSTWNESSTGVPWGAPGMASGTEYGPALGSTTVAYGFSGRVVIPLTFEAMSLSGDHVWLIVATPNTGAASMRVVTSEGVDVDRPIVELNYTEVFSLSVGMGSTTLTAGTSGSVFASAVNVSNGPLTPSGITYSVSDGSMNGATWTPVTAGQQWVKACFGAVCDTLMVTVVPNSPTTLVVSPLTTTITADDSLDIVAMVTDNWGNEVVGETITFVPSDGSMNGATFHPVSAGAQTVDVTWQSSTITVDVEVLPGAPDQILLSGCSGTVPAGTTCDVTHVVVDQHGNEMDVEEAGGLTWTTTDGNYSEVEMTYEADHVGTWLLSVTSASGASGTLDITVGHGEMAALEVSASSLSITADELVYLNTTRIDVRGNRLLVVLPEDNWTRIADGSLLAGQPAVWSPTSRGAKVIEARYETFLSSVSIAVSQGEMVQLLMVVDSVDVNDESFTMTADEILTASVRAVDQKGNRWSVVANWSVDHPVWSDQGVLSQLGAQASTFRPVLADEAAYTLEAVHMVDGASFTARISITVVHGDLYGITLDAVTLEDGDAGTSFDMTADDGLVFSVTANDAEGNPIPTDGFTWTIRGDDGEADISASLLATNLRWEATMVGSWIIEVTGLTNGGAEVVRSVEVEVSHGVAVRLIAPEPEYALFAGDHTQIDVTGIDADGNTFPQDVLWTEGLGDATDINATGGATYDYFARRAGSHSLTYEVNGVEGTWNVTVEPQTTVNRFEMTLSSSTVDQLANVTLTVSAWDAYDNQIPVPPSTTVFYSDADGTPLFQGVDTVTGVGTWYLLTMNDGTYTVTVTAGSVNAELDLTVEGTLNGFFVSNSPVSYIGVGLGAVVAVTLAVLLLRVVRSGSNNEWDDDDDDDDDVPTKGPAAGPSGTAPGPAAGPSGPAPGPAAGPSGPAPGPSDEPEAAKEVPALTDAHEAVPEEAAEASSDAEINVDEDGTEWYEDEQGVWWYRMQGETEWSEWKD